MRTLIAAFMLISAGAGLAHNVDTSVKLINEEQAKACTATGIVSHSKLAMFSIDKATQALLQEALKQARKKGANAAVMMPLTSNRNLYTVMLQTYVCP